jgi:prephenate dehydratase
VRIAYQGEPGAYSEAAIMRLGADIDALPCRSFEDVFAAVEEGRASAGILPIENSVGGSIHRNYDLLAQHDIPIVGEVQLRVEHKLLAAPGVRFEDITRIYSHPQALAQCERFLQGLDRVEIVATYDTAGSAKMIGEGGLRDVAAIASERAARVFGLSVLRSGLEDFEANITRFLIIGRTPLTLGKPDKTSIVFSVPNVPGSLLKALTVFAWRDIDLTKLESRPIRGRPWEYLFYVDLAIGRDEPRCARALAQLAEFALSLRTLGSYRAWREPETADTNETPAADPASVQK